ncbi:hypothetical protein [Actinoplanes regularis]|uniref:hypothetical protein n=1 Tax=Actinoplanes regularis TaxID=52697 RepID=UPI0024A2E53B|nr:hypothetical protein [Actinoplanes regularis]GLW33073.1 hypothetical protein Areg01_60110 [Actinoplanes regularis]
MRIPVYLDGFQPPLGSSPLVDASGWMTDELFWPAFLLQVGMARSAPHAFDADLADLDVYLDRFEQPDQWPVFTVPLANGAMYLVVCNLPDDTGIDWVLDTDAQEAHQRGAGSGLPWGLLPRRPEHLLMALPAFGDHDPGESVRTTVAEALRAVGAASGIDELAEDLLRHRACIIL